MSPSSSSQSQVHGTDAVVSYVHDESTEMLPQGVRLRVERCLLDTLGAITAGHRLDGSREAVRYVEETFADGETTILDGEGSRAQTDGAVLANSVAANALDVDDGHVGADGHPAAIIVPSALAAAEDVEAAVDELLTAILIGYEVAVRVGRVLPKVTGHHTGTGSWGPVGAAAAVARLRDFSPETTADALSIAEFNAPQTPILRSVAAPGSGMTKDGVGWGGYVGTMAASMAERGFEGSGTVFDESESDAAASLGETYEIMDAYFKPYSCCRWIHPGIDAVRSLYDEHDIDPGDILAVRVHTFENAMELRTSRPESADEGEYSYPYVLATVLREQTFTPEHLQDDALGDEAVHELADRIEFVHDESLEARYDEAWLARVEIETPAETYASDVTHPRGSVERPLTEREHQTKQRSLIDSNLGEGTASELRELVADGDTEVAELLGYWRHR